MSNKFDSKSLLSSRNKKLRRDLKRGNFQESRQELQTRVGRGFYTTGFNQRLAA